MTTLCNQFVASPPAEWLTAAEAAQYLKVKVRTLLLWVRQGKVKAFALSVASGAFAAATWTRPFWNPLCYHPKRHPCALKKGWGNEKGSTAQNWKCSFRQTT